MIARTNKVMTGREQREFKALERRFRQSGINTSKFGFYNERAFLKEEERDSNIIQSYARWVSLRPRDEAYEQHVRAVVPKLTHILADAFKADSLEGGCQAAMGMLPLMLNRIGVWSFGVIGSTILEVRERSIRETLAIIDIKDSPNAELGHAWVVAPPFRIVDPTISLQHWAGRPIKAFIPEYLAVESNAEIIIPTANDMVGDRFRRRLEAQTRQSLNNNIHHERIPNLAEFNEDFPAYATTIGYLHLRYCPTKVLMADQPLEGIMSSGFRRSAAEIWTQAVEPAYRSSE